MPQPRPTRTLRLLCMAATVALAGLALPGPDVLAEVFHSRESALVLAFGENAQIESRELFLDRLEQERASKLAGSEIPSRLVKVYEGRRKGEVTGFAYFETHRVRSLPETLMVVVDGGGRILGVHVLAFHEPEAYLPHEAFLQQFREGELNDELSLRNGIQGMAGSTFTAQAVSAAVRRVLAVHSVLVQPQLASTQTLSNPQVD